MLNATPHSQPMRLIAFKWNGCLRSPSGIYTHQCVF